MKQNDFSIDSKENVLGAFISKAVCSQGPAAEFLNEFVVQQLKELAYYLLKLKIVGIKNEKIKDNFLETISCLVVGINFNEKQFLEITSRLACDLKQAKDLYIAVCNKNYFKCAFLHTSIKLPKQISVASAIKFGQKIAIKRDEIFTADKKTLFEAILSIMKSICIHIIDLKMLEAEINDYYEKLLSIFDSLSAEAFDDEKLKLLIKEFSEFDHILLIELSKVRQKRYGVLAPADVVTTTRANKAILVAGTNLRELEILLEATKGKDIDIYTHGHMLMAHSFPKFRAYPNLVGHFGKGIESYLLDFAEFPGPVFLTRHSAQRVENLYRSRIFTTDMIAPRGVIILRDDNYEPLIESALCSKGFTKSVQKPHIHLNLDEKVLLEKISEAANKFVSGEYKNLITIGVSNHTKVQQDYFEKFLRVIEDDTFVLSFSYANSKENIVKVESDYGSPMLYAALDILNEKINFSEINACNLMTRCEVHTISNAIYLKNHWFDKIYFTDCHRNMINPAHSERMREIFDLKSYTTPEADYKQIVSKN